MNTYFIHKCDSFVASLHQVVLRSWKGISQLSMNQELYTDRQPPSQQSDLMEGKDM